MDILSAKKPIEDRPTATVVRILIVGWWLFTTETPR
jgi:hypothetical protein